MTLLWASGCSEPAGPGAEGGPLPEIGNAPLPVPLDVNLQLLGSNLIAFERIQGGVSGLYVVGGAFGGATGHLGGTNMDGPVVSPSGTAAAFRTLTPYDDSLEPGAQTAWDIYVVQLDGSGLRRITSFEGNAESPPSWSADGRSILFSVSQVFVSGGSDVDLVEQTSIAAPSEHHIIARLRNADPVFWELEVAPVAKSSAGRIALANNAGGSAAGIHLLEPGSMSPLQVYDSSGDDATRVWAPAWSPDGRRLAFLETFESGDGGSDQETRVKVLALDDGSVTEIARIEGTGPGFEDWSGHYTLSACWTADASLIVFSTGDGDLSAHIYVVPAEGGDPLRLTAAPVVTDRSVSCPG